MRLHLPSSLLRYVLASLFICTFPAASGADYTVNNTQSAMPGSNLYGTLEELRASGLLRANDTVVLHNDDSTLTGGLNLLINVQSDNTAGSAHAGSGWAGNNSHVFPEERRPWR